MKTLLSLSALLTGLATATPPTDPILADKIDRSLKKSPELHSSAASYALAVIGKEATRQSWIVFDLTRATNRKLTGHIYVDLNGDRDLTQPNEKISLPKADGSFYQTEEVKFTDAAGEPNGYGVKFVAANLEEHPAPIHYRVMVTTPSGDQFGAWGDQNSELSPTQKVETAPVLHFDGPRQMGFEILEPLTKGDGNWQLNAGVGTNGLGDGSFVFQFYKTIPKDKHPTASISWPARKKGSPPLVSKFILKDRC